MPTLLESVNELLISVGEREVSSTNVYHARTAVNALRKSFNDVQLTLQHLFRTQITASSWSTHTATVNNLLRLYDVVYHDTGYMRVLTELSPDYTPFTQSEPGIPQTYYRLPFKNQVFFYPYPDTTDERNKVIFDCTILQSIPASDAASWVLPNDLVYSIMMTGALAYYALYHLDDANAYQTYLRQFQTQMSQLTQADNRPLNLYRRRR